MLKSFENMTKFVLTFWWMSSFSNWCLAVEVLILIVKQWNALIWSVNFKNQFTNYSNQNELRCGAEFRKASANRHRMIFTAVRWKLSTQCWTVRCSDGSLGTAYGVNVSWCERWKKNGKTHSGKKETFLISNHGTNEWMSDTICYNILLCTGLSAVYRDYLSSRVFTEQ